MIGLISPRAWLALGAVAVVLAILGLIYWQGGADTRQKAREITLEREKDITDAIHSCADLPWYQRLQCDE